MTYHVTTLGEGQIRFTSGAGHSLRSAHALPMYVAGTEINVVSTLARLDRRTAFVSILPDNPLADRILAELRGAGVDVSGVARSEQGRVALYFVDEKLPPFPSSVLYDRKESSFSLIQPGDVDWGILFSGDVVHLSGITPALTPDTRNTVEETLTRAQEARKAVSFDINYRRNLWTASDAAAWFDKSLPGRIAVLSCARRDAAVLFGIEGDSSRVARELADRFGAGTVLVSDGPHPATCFSEGREYTRAPLKTTVLDRIGAGDALIAGFLHGYLDGDIERALAMGVAAASLALTRHGEQLHTTKTELEALAERVGGEDIQR